MESSSPTTPYPIMMATYLGWKSTILKDTQEIRVLAVNITHYLDGSSQFQQHGLRHEDFSGLVAQRRYVLDRYSHGRPRWLRTWCQQQFDDSVDSIVGGIAIVVVAFYHLVSDCPWCCPELWVWFSERRFDSAFSLFWWEFESQRKMGAGEVQNEVKKKRGQKRVRVYG